MHIQSTWEGIFALHSVTLIRRIKATVRPMLRAHTRGAPNGELAHMLQIIYTHIIVGNLRSLRFNNQELFNQLTRFIPRERVPARPLSGCARRSVYTSKAHSRHFQALDMQLNCHGGEDGQGKSIAWALSKVVVRMHKLLRHPQRLFYLSSILLYILNSTLSHIFIIPLLTILPEKRNIGTVEYMYHHTYLNRHSGSPLINSIGLR